MKIAEKSRFFVKFQQKIWKSLTKICEDFEFRAVQRRDHLVDLEKRCKMSIWTQKSALIQLRTSLLKFDDLAEKSEKSSVSNFSTKDHRAPPYKQLLFVDRRGRSSTVNLRGAYARRQVLLP